jgi:glycosyltransferase involved in cell wall biosynthesis
MKDIHPKVLIIGETFHNDTGGGITISNLFSEWPAGKLAVITLNDKNDYKICNNYYRIGIDEKNIPRIFRLLLKIRNSDEINVSEKNTHSPGSLNGVGQSHLKIMILRIVGSLSHFIGLHHKLHSISVSERLLNWINTFKPEIVYFQPNSLPLVLFVKQLHQKIKIPIALHIVDDYVKTKNKPGLFYYHYERRIKHEYNEIVKRSKIHFSICKEMSKEYNTRFNKEFIPVHNPIIKEKWLPYFHNNFEQNSTYCIVYAGRIGIANVEAIIILVDVIDQLCNEGVSIEFDIYSIDEDRKLLRSIKSKRGSHFKSFISHNKLPKIISKYDFLYLPLSTNRKSLRYTRLSMPTKVAEYMISGKPVIVFSSPATALYKYATTEKWATVVDNKEKLKIGIRNLINSKELREKYGKTAQKLALDNHEIKVVTKKFTDALLSKIHNEV